jgi:GT2 family glycosyltransferase/glycosyltransferase involved in cell wall biosynthesis
MIPNPSHNRANALREHSYPRMLIVYHNCINNADQHGVSIRGWFSDWPKDRLAQIYSGGESGSERFCGHVFKLGNQERRFGKLFFKLKSSSFRHAGLPVVQYEQQPTGKATLSYFGLLKRATGRLLFNSGLWELIFQPKLSTELKQWVNDFRPEIIYCQGYTISFAWLPLMLSKEFALPICFQTGDDWPMNRYSKSPTSIIMTPIVRKAARDLIKRAVVRFSNGETMAHEYLKRYQVTFEPLMMGDDYSRFDIIKGRRLVDEKTISVVYTGSLGSMRCAPLIDLCLAAQELQTEGFVIVVTALATGVPPESVNELRCISNLTVLPAPSHEDLPAYLRGADVLFLPESFDEKQAASIRLSISTKAHLYMMSERPVLIYGHRITGIMDYARRTDWACRVDRKDRQFLKDALRRLITDKAYCRQLVSKGREIAIQQHDERVIREKIRRMLCDAVMGIQHPRQRSITEISRNISDHQPEITILVLSHNRLDELQKNIPFLTEYSERTGSQLVVVDNASRTDVQDYLMSMKALHPVMNLIQNEKNEGVAGGRNTGFAVARGKYILSLDDDTRIPTEVLAQVPSIFEKNPGAGILAFRVRHPVTHIWENPHGEVQCYLANHHGAGCAIRREVIDKLGGIDPKCRFGSEEIDLCIRAKDMGLGVLYCPDCIVWHNSVLQKQTIKAERMELRAYNNARVMYKYFSARVARMIANRYLISLLSHTLSVGKLALSFQLIRASRRGRQEGIQQHRQVSVETERFYSNPGLLPDFGNHPLHVKFMVKARRLLCGSIRRQQTP